MERHIAKAIVRHLFNMGVHTSFLAIHARMADMGHHIGARFVGELLKEIEIEAEAEMWSMLVEHDTRRIQS